MPSTMILVGDVNLMNLDDPAVPFARLEDEFAGADILFGNLECLLYEPPDGHTVEQEGFFADPAIGGEALKIAGFAAVGLANNVNYGSAAILGSIARLDRLGIAHTGAGENLAAARAPAIVERGGLRVGLCPAQLGLLADQPRGRRARRRHRRAARPHRLSGAGAQDPARDPADEPARHPADRRHLAGPRLSGGVRRGYRGGAPAGRHRRRLVPLGAGRGGARLHDRDRPRRDRCRRRCGDRPRPALFAAGRGLQGQADLLRARQLLVPHRAWRPPPRRLDRHDGDEVRDRRRRV